MTVLTVSDCHTCCFEERPKYKLLELLGEKGVYKLTAILPPSRLRGVRDPFQAITVYTLVWGGGLQFQRVEGMVVYSEKFKGRDFVFLWSRGSEYSDAVYVRGEGRLRHELLASLPSKPKPIIALDFSLIDTHSPAEAESLRRQVGASLGTIRRYLWDRHMLLSSIQPGVHPWLRAFMATPHVQVTSLPADQALYMQGYTRIILLDPGAEKPLTPQEVLTAEAFIIGAIVDREPRPGATRELKLKGYYTPRRLELRGSIQGVPSRLNMVTEIILKARYEYCGNIEKAIVSTMSPRDARLRAAIELSRWSRSRRRRVPCSLYYLLSSWLPLTPRDFIRAVRMAGLDLENGGECRDKLLGANPKNRVEALSGRG